MSLRGKRPVFSGGFENFTRFRVASPTLVCIILIIPGREAARKVAQNGIWKVSGRRFTRMADDGFVYRTPTRLWMWKTQDVLAQEGQRELLTGCKQGMQLDMLLDVAAKEL